MTGPQTAALGRVWDRRVTSFFNRQVDAFKERIDKGNQRMLL